MRIFDTVIVGAGLSGLAIGHRLQKMGQAVHLFEKSGRCGGALRSEKKDGFLLEHGPNTVPAKPHLISFIEELALINRMVVAGKNTARFIQFRDRLHRTPPGPLSLAGMLRTLKEPWVTQTKEEESVWQFFERRFGVEVAARLVAPFVSGIWAGDAKELAMESAFPAIAPLEKRHGSVTKGLFFGKNQPRSKIRGLISFRDGIQTLTDKLAQNLAGHIAFNVSVNEITANPWTLQTSLGPISAKNLVLAAPAMETARLIKNISKEAAAALEQIPYAPIKVIHLGFNRTQIKHTLKGFGYLVAPSEKKTILGCLWSSSFFPQRAPEDSVLLTVFVGGRTNPEQVKKENNELVREALVDLNSVLGITGSPTMISITTYDKAIPQYTFGHSKRIKAIEQMEKDFRGLYFSGNYRGGISVGDVIQNALNTANQLQKSVRD